MVCCSCLLPQYLLIAHNADMQSSALLYPHPKCLGSSTRTILSLSWNPSVDVPCPTNDDGRPSPRGVCPCALDEKCTHTRTRRLLQDQLFLEHSQRILREVDCGRTISIPGCEQGRRLYRAAALGLWTAHPFSLLLCSSPPRFLHAPSFSDACFYIHVHDSRHHPCRARGYFTV